MDIKKLVGRNVAKHRKGKGWSQEQLAFETELHRTYISGIERGIRNPTVTIIYKIALSLEISPDKLLRINP